VIAADTGALPETCGGAARLAAPGDVADALLALLADPGERKRLAAAGRARAAAVSWVATARAVDALLSEAAGAPTRETPPAPAC
jgi:alpha-1,3-rhamnosyl/mannosyltransferase